MWSTLFPPDKVPAYQLIVYILTLAVIWWQATLLRRQIRTSDYLRCQIDFTETLRALVASGRHAHIYDYLARSGTRLRGWQQYGDPEKEAYAYLELMYALIERVHIAFQQKAITLTEWNEWQKWLEGVAANQLLHDVHEDSRGVFNAEYQALVDSVLKKNS
jgi:hypothetical protein